MAAASVCLRHLSMALHLVSKVLVSMTANQALNTIGQFIYKVSKVLVGEMLHFSHIMATFIRRLKLLFVSFGYNVHAIRIIIE